MRKLLLGLTTLASMQSYAGPMRFDFQGFDSDSIERSEKIVVVVNPRLVVDGKGYLIKPPLDFGPEEFYLNYNKLLSALDLCVHTTGLSYSEILSASISSSYTKYHETGIFRDITPEGREDNFVIFVTRKGVKRKISVDVDGKGTAVLGSELISKKIKHPYFELRGQNSTTPVPKRYISRLTCLLK